MFMCMGYKFGSTFFSKFDFENINNTNIIDHNKKCYFKKDKLVIIMIIKKYK